MQGIFHPVITVCECPCHNSGHPMEVNDEHECCCPHRFVVAMDCPTCSTKPEPVPTPKEAPT